MILLTPLWLGLLVPWAAACVWMGRAGGPQSVVPYLPLWPRSPGVSGARRRRPPAWVLLLLLASLLAILAAAGPAVERPATVVTVLVDRGLSMPPARRRAAFARLTLPPATRVRLAAVLAAPGTAEEDRAAADVPAALDRLPTTAFDTAAGLLRPAPPAADGPLVLLTDQPAAGDRPGVVRVGPDGPLRNAGIDLFAVTAGPHPQAMVRVFNGTNQRRAVLRVDTVRQAIALPPSGETKDVFLDLPAVGDTTEAALLAADGSRWTDDVPADDRAYLARTHQPGRIEPRTPPGVALARMVAVYARQRPAGADAPPIAIVRGPTDAAAVVLADRFEGGGGAAGPSVVRFDHPILKWVELGPLGAIARTHARPAGAGWRPIVTDGGDWLVAVREAPARQVWVGFEADALATRPEYVVFWTNVFDWLAGGGSGAWDAGPVRSGTMIAAADPAAEASPGLVRVAPDGPVIATAVRAVRPRPPLALPPAAVTGRVTRLRVSLTGGLLLAALAFAAAGLWAGFRLTRS